MQEKVLEKLLAIGKRYTINGVDRIYFDVNALGIDIKKDSEGNITGGNIEYWEWLKDSFLSGVDMERVNWYTGNINVAVAKKLASGKNYIDLITNTIVASKLCGDRIAYLALKIRRDLGILDSDSDDSLLWPAKKSLEQVRRLKFLSAYALYIAPELNQISMDAQDYTQSVYTMSMTDDGQRALMRFYTAVLEMWDDEELSSLSCRLREERENPSPYPELSSVYRFVLQRPDFSDLSPTTRENEGLTRRVAMYLKAVMEAERKWLCDEDLKILQNLIEDWINK